MVKISIDDVEHMGELARINISKEQIGSFRQELEKILSYIENLESAPTEKVKVVPQISGLKNVSREDKITPSLSVEKVLQNAPQRKDNFIKVKKIFE